MTTGEDWTPDDELMASIYRQLDNFHGSAEAEYDVEAGLARLQEGFRRLQEDTEYRAHIERIARRAGKRYEWHEECDGPICQGCDNCACEGGCRCQKAGDQASASSPSRSQ
jgi:hypothetical protein